MRGVPIVAAILLVASCAAPPAPSTTTAPPTASGGPVTLAEQKLAVLATVGEIHWCDPDAFPVAGDETAAMEARWPEIEDDPSYAVVATRVGVDPAADPTDEERLAIYREWKRLEAIVLDPVGARQAFEVFTAADANGRGERITGSVGPAGDVEIAGREAVDVPTCPICLALGTRIATPNGDVAVEALRVGVIVWTLDADGRRRAEPIVRIGQARAPATHEVVRLALADGRVVRGSPGHPLADGRRLGVVRPGDTVDGSHVTSAAREAYPHGRTFDILPAGDTGTYIADGIPLASTLR